MDDLFTIKGQRPRQRTQTHDEDGDAESRKQAEKLKPSTRLIVKNLPKHITEQAIKDHFSKVAEVTDVKIMKTKEGKSRRFGFVGYASLEAAKEARNYFNDTYLHTSKMGVEYAQPFGDTAIPRAWSKYSKDSSAFQTLHAPPEEKVNKNKKGMPKQPSAEAQKDAKLQEFIDTLQKGSKVWMNDDSGVRNLSGKAAEGAKVTATKKSKAKKAQEAKEVSVQKVPNRKPGGQGLFVTRQHVTFSAESDDDGEADGEADNKMQVDDAGAGLEEASSDGEYEDLPAAKRAKLNSGGASKSSDESDDEAKEPPKQQSGGSALDWLKSKAKDTKDIEKLLEESSGSDDEDSGSDSDSDSDDDVDAADETTADKPSSDNQKSRSSSSKSRSGSSKSSSSSDSDDAEPAPQTPAAPAADTRGQQAGTMEDLAQIGRIFVRNLSYATTEEDLYKLFSKYGQISTVHLTIDKATKQSKGFGFVQFLIPAQAVKAFTELDAKIFQGRLLHLIPAKPPPQKDPTVRKTRDEKQFMSDFQKKKEEKMKQLAGEDFNWSTLFIRADTVANAMAAQFNVEKGELFDRENSGSLGVRMALGETNIIADTKKFLEKEGVSLEALQGVYNKNIERSTTTMLIRNIPFSATVEELKNLFSRFGTLNKLVMPATKALALVDFAAAQEARAAFRGLAYKQFKGAPLYLEWAPIGIIDAKKAAAAESAEEADEEKAASVPVSAASADEDDDTDSDATQTTLFVKNLSFGTSDNTFRSTIEGLLGPVRAITIARRRDNETGKMLSQGFGFVECASRQQALDGYKKLPGITIDGHQLQVTFSSRGGDADASKNSKKRKRVSRSAPPSTTIMVRNIPFQASKKEVRELFAAFGELKSVRLPNKAGGQGHRGFAFIEYLTKDEAKQAMEAVENSRLYGRHLVLEFAKDGDENQDVDALREKTALLYKKTHPGPM